MTARGNSRTATATKWRWALAATFLLAAYLGVAAGDPAHAATDGQTAGQTAGQNEGIQHYRDLLQSGTVNNNLGRFEAAEQSFREALEACTQVFGADHPDCGDAVLRLALEISNQERYEEAAIMFQRAEPLARAASSPLDFPRYLTYLAMDRANRHEFTDAFDLVTKANHQRQGLVQTQVAAAGKGERGAKQGLDRTMADLAHGLFVQASVALKLDRLDEARVTAHLARRLILRVKSVPKWWTANVDELLAVIDLRQGKSEDAKERLELALETKRLALGNTRAVALSHLTLGSVYNVGQEDLAAIQAMRPGLAIINNELGEVPGVDVERLIPFLVSAQIEAENAPDKRAALYAEMFTASQLVRSNGTAKAVARMALRFASDNPAIAALVQQTQEATRQRDRLRLDLGRTAIAQGSGQGSGQGNSRTMAELRQDYARAVKTADALEAELTKAFPEYARLAIPSPVTGDQVSALLGPGEALIQILVGEKESFGFLVQGSEITATPLGIGRAALEATIRELRQPFEQNAQQIAPFDMAAAHGLYRTLLGPFERQLEGTRHLVVTTTGALLSLPFPLLVTTPPTGLRPDDYGRAAWLSRRMAVSVMPSIRAFTDLRGLVKPSAAPRAFVGFGDPSVAGTANGKGMAALAGYCRTNAPVPPELIRGLAPLPKTADEIRHVARVLGAQSSDIFLGAAATEERFRQIPLDQYRILYFATHGLLPGELNCQSEPGLVLTPPAGVASDQASDGMLDASEIAGLRLDADLVVLSACNTGGGSGRFGGDSLSGLVRAFFQAGARSLIVSHWQVDSTATTQLMSSVFDRIANESKLMPAEALRQAQMSLVNNPQTAHPFFWAAFTLVGVSSMDRQISSRPAADITD